MYFFEDSVIMDIDPARWSNATNYTADVAECNADFFRIRRFGDIYIYDTSRDFEEEYLYDLYLSKGLLELDGFKDNQSDYYGYITMSDFKHMASVDVRENLQEPGFYIEKNSLQESVFKTFNKFRDLINKEPMPFCGNYRLMGQVYNDHPGTGYKRTSVELYFNYIYVYDHSGR